MASEILAVPEEDLAEVVIVIRAGMTARYRGQCLSRREARVKRELTRWCKEEIDYMQRMLADD